MRATALLAVPAGLTVAALAIPGRDVAGIILAGTALGIGGLAWWQLRVGRPRALTLNVLAGVAMGLMAPFVPTEIGIAVGTGIVVITMAGIPLLAGRGFSWYLTVMVLAWASHLGAQYLIRADWSAPTVMAFTTEAMFLVFGITYLLGMRAQMHRSEQRYAYLFSRVHSWLEELRAAGVTDLRDHLEGNPAELRHGIGLVATADANFTAASLLGAAAPADLLGPFPDGVIDAESERLFLEQFASIWEHTSGGEREYSGRRLDGSRFQGILRWPNPLVAGGDLSHVVSAVSEVTRLRRAEAELASSETTNRALLDAMPDLLFLYGPDGTYLDYRAANEVRAAPGASGSGDLFAHPNVFLGKKPAEVLPSRVAEEISIAIATTLETSHVQTLEYQLPIDGRERHWEMRLASLQGRNEVLALVRDITDRVRARRELEQLVKSKDDFIATISHELRTPLTAIVGYAHLLKGETGLDATDRLEMVETLIDQSTDLSNRGPPGRRQGRPGTPSGGQSLHQSAGPGRAGAQGLRSRGVRPRDAARPRRALHGRPGPGAPDRPQSAHQRLPLRRGLRGDSDHPGRGDGPAGAGGQRRGDPHRRSRERVRALPPLGSGGRAAGGLGIGLPLSRTLANLMGGDLTYHRAGGETRFTLSLPLADPDPPAERERRIASLTTG